MSHTSRSTTPLRDAVNGLLNASCHTPKEIAEIAGVGEDKAAEWFRKTTLPSNRNMTLILHAFEGSKESVVAEALSQFWDKIQAIKESQNDHTEIYPLDGDHLDLPSRLLQFTHCEWEYELSGKMKHVHPRHRSACLRAMAEVIDRFTTNDQ